MKPPGTFNNCLNWLHSPTDNIICDLIKWQWNKFGLRCSTYYILCSNVYDKFLYDDYSEELRKQIQIEM